MNSIDDSGLAGPPDCGALLEKIKQALYEFNKDYSNQKRETDAGNLAQWAGHDLELRQRQHRLQELLAQWNRGNCGEKAQFKNDKEAQAVIRDASEAARRELPTPFKAMGGGLGPAAAAGAIMAFLAWLFSKLKAGIGPVRRPVFPVIPVAPIL